MLKSSIMVTVAMLVVLVALGFMPQREQVINAMKQILPMNQATSTKITVYQSQGQKGETKFSDRQDDLHHAHARIVDTAKGTTFHTTLPSSEEKKSSKKLSFSEDNERFQRQAQTVQQARMEQVIGE